MAKIVVTDYTFEDLAPERAIIEAAGHELIGAKCETQQELVELCGDADVVITQFAQVDSTVVEAMQSAKAIVRYGIGYDNVAFEAAAQRGIPVCNIPDYCIDEVADHTLAFILGVTRDVRANNALIAEGSWGLANGVSTMVALSDLTIGVIGLGRIGREVVARLQPFKCRIVAADPIVTQQQALELGCELVSQEEVFAQADLLTLHCPSLESTKNMVNAASLSTMKQGAMIVNVGRGDLIDLEALVAALDSGQILTAGLDVFSTEPLPSDHPVRNMKNVLVSSHVASVSPKAIKKLRESVAEIALAAISGDELPNVVNGVN
ncbi:MAG: hydroxyacid dehydrogenase [Rhodopirellula sp.]|nr:hydroxyacid dehydrogenase [Rhodopirellula sp.]